MPPQHAYPTSLPGMPEQAGIHVGRGSGLGQSWRPPPPFLPCRQAWYDARYQAANNGGSRNWSGTSASSNGPGFFPRGPVAHQGRMPDERRPLGHTIFAMIQVRMAHQGDPIVKTAAGGSQVVAHAPSPTLTAIWCLYPSRSGTRSAPPRSPRPAQPGLSRSQPR